jgi:hypothetical protein
MVGSLMNDELDRLWNKVIEAYVRKILSWNLPGDLVEVG